MFKIPLLKPNKDESREQFVSRFMSSESAKNEYKDEKQRLAVAYSTWKESKKSKERFSHMGLLSYKENDLELIVKGYIATTHFDGQDIITKETLEKWAKEINDGNPRANKVSINHNRQPHVAGLGIKGTARVDRFNDGEYGLYAETMIDKTREDFKEIKYRIDKGFLDSFSIEYLPPTNPVFDEAIGARILDKESELFGWTIASQPMNEHAVMIKELVHDRQSVPEQKENTEIKEVSTMAEETKIEQKEETISKEDLELLKEAKEQKAKLAQKEMLLNLLKDDSVKKELDLGLKTENKVLSNKEEEEVEDDVEDKEVVELKSSIEYKEYKDMLGNKEISIEEKFRRAGALAEKKGLIWQEGVDSIGYKTSKAYEPKVGVPTSMKFKTFGTNGTQLQFKSLGITSNQNTDTDYLLSSAELRDMFDPVIYDVLNQSTLTWGILRKEDMSMKGNNQVQFVIRNGANSTAGWYTGNSVSTDNEDLLKVQTKFKKVQVGISVDGDMIAAARGGPMSDVFAEHVRLSTMTMLNVVNQSLFDEVGLETAAAPIGFEYITDSAGNTTLYNLTRSTTTGLAPTTATDTYINGSSVRISLDNLRLAIQQALIEGANLNNLVFITHPIQERLFKGIFDAERRYMDTSSRFGFEGRPQFDGVPIFADKDCNTDDWFLVDLESHKVAIWVPPTLEMLGKRSDSVEGFVKMYMATYNTNPNRMVQIYGNATS